ncbi:transport and Golgi organization 2 homolog isoform X2 [Schistocerca gregaria]|nr:transport and Golgi organization 2 homolog isoform X2 [Schistocerca gregaria]
MVCCGTWLGMSTSGRLSLLTNRIELLEECDSSKKPHGLHHQKEEDCISRGNLPVEFLCGDSEPAEFLKQLDNSPRNYRHYNLIVGNGVDDLQFYSDAMPNRIVKLERGKIHGLSNASLNTPSFKVEKGKKMLENMRFPDPDKMAAAASQCTDNRPSVECRSLFRSMFEILRDSEKQPCSEDHPCSHEYLCSSIYVERHVVPPANESDKRTDAERVYGTRSSAIILVDRKDRVTFYESGFEYGAKNKWMDQVFHWKLQPM